MNLQQKYTREDFLQFLKQFLPDFNPDVRRVTSNGSRVTKDALYLGHSNLLELHIFELSHLSSSDARVTLAADGFRIMKDSATYRALIVYRSEKEENWRLSLMAATPGIDEKGKIRQTFSNPRRYSFFLGPDTKTRTPDEYLIKQGQLKDFEDLKRRFSIEVVNKEFYTQIALLFTKLAGGKREIGRKSLDAGSGSLRLPSTSDDTLRKEFTVRLIGRLVFCWFLKKKRSEKGIPLLPEELLSSEAVVRNKNYYHTVLEPLFFQVLNTQMGERKKKYQSQPWVVTPFLNGGLFSPHHHDFYELGAMEISKHINTLKVPDEWFKELFEVFETYNFTIDENTSVDVELSIEPEMLGRIFENLLAEINPETGETARKATGSYYTPRPIVEYMVDESLKQYLLTKTKLNENEITSLLSYEETEIGLTAAKKQSVLDALDSIKIIDPACGSGAFPMGILQKMLLMLQKIDPESQVWLDKKLSKIESKLLKKAIGRKLKSENVNYVHKLGIIQSSIYGVDIQPIAVEISKLRFFLSLIVDETVNDSKENRGVEPLPNLEFKFVCANSLIGLPKLLEKGKLKGKLEKTETQRTMFDAVNEIDELKELRDEYLRSFGGEKAKIEKRFREVQTRMFKYSVDWGGKDSQTLKLSQWNPFGEVACSWFDPDWMFGIKEGFDIVIANPPYIFGGNAIISQEDKVLFKKIFFSGSKKINLFALFIEKGITLLCPEGFLTYIVPNTLLRVTSYDRIRQYIVTKTQIKEVVDLDAGIFENVTASTIILALTNSKAEKGCGVRIKRGIYEDRPAILNQDVFKNDGYILDIFSNQDERKVIEKLFVDSVMLGDLAIYIRFGVVISKNIDEVVATKKASDNWKPFLEGDEIGRYYINYSGRYLHYARKKLHRSRTPDVFESPKIMIQRITGGDSPINATFDRRKFYNKESIINLVLKNKQDDEYKFILGVVNSKLINWYYQKKFTNNSKLTVNLSKEYLGQIPIRIASESNKRKIASDVEKILQTTKKENYFRGRPEQEKVESISLRLDQMVYELYHLTEEEIKIVEGVATG